MHWCQLKVKDFPCETEKSHALILKPTLPLLRDRAENDPDDKLRELAQNKLAQLENQRS
ncbi:hypothetical protein [Coleofasciculus sp. E1-EBD-02]|uniref:hypothetical protein n=1 Tax=Coleofasciculus sp. E1-EBD-02 TaxID=3068481 RepID=UPI0032F42B0B